LGAALGLAAAFGFATLAVFGFGAALGFAAAGFFVVVAFFATGFFSVVFFSALGFSDFGLAAAGSFLASLVPPELPARLLGATPQERWQTRTLWLSEDTLLDTRLESAVEQRVEHGVGCGDLVVGLDILLEGDAAVQKSAVIDQRRVKRAR